MKLFNLTIIAAALCASLPAQAQEPQAKDLIDVYQDALESDPQLRAARAGLRAARTANPQARALLRPQVDAGGSIDRSRFDDRTDLNEDSYSTNQNYAITLRQPLYRRDLFVSRDQADAQIAQAEAEFAAVEQDLYLRVSEAYFGVLSAEDDLLFALAERKAINRQLEQARKRFEVGLIAITDVHEAQAAYDLATARTIAAENQLDTAWEILRELTGQYYEDLEELAEQVELTRPDPEDIREWADTASVQNYRLLAAQRAVEVARLQRELARAERYPGVDAVASHGYVDSRFGGVFDVERFETQVGVEFNVPIFTSGLISSRVREAAFRFEQAQEDYETQLRRTLRQASDAYRGVVSEISRVNALRQARTSNESALEATEAGFEVGTRTIVDVLQAQSNLFRARRDFAQSRYDYVLNSLRLKQAAGTLALEDLQQINRWLEDLDATEADEPPGVELP